MVFLIYLAVFVWVFFIRYRGMSGASMKMHVDNGGRVHFESISSAGRKSPNFNVRIGIPCEHKLYFKVTREGTMSRLLKSLGVVVEFQSGDHDTDKMLFVSDDPRLFQDILRTAPIREALRKLFTRHKRVKIRAFGHRIWLEADDVPPGWLDEQRQGILAHLWEVANAAEKSADQRAARAPRFSYAQRAALFLVMHATLLTGGILGFAAFVFGDMHIENLQRLVLAAAGLTPLIVIAWVGVMLTVLRRSMWLVLALGDFVLVGLAGIALTMPLLAIEANQRLPQAPATVEYKQMLDKQCDLYCKQTRRRRGSVTRSHYFTPHQCKPENRQAQIDALKSRDHVCRSSARMRYRLVFPEWREGDTAQYILDVEAARFDAHQPGDTFAIPVHPGAFGSSWVDEDEILPAHDPQAVR